MSITMVFGVNDSRAPDQAAAPGRRPPSAVNVSGDGTNAARRPAPPSGSLPRGQT